MNELERSVTAACEPADPPRQEADLQRYLADRLAAAGASIDLWEPETGSLGSPRQVPPGLAFAAARSSSTLRLIVSRVTGLNPRFAGNLVEVGGTRQDWRVAVGGRVMSRRNAATANR
jgi:hypothetical protein